MSSPIPSIPEELDALRRQVQEQQQALVEKEAALERQRGELSVHRQLLSDRDNEIAVLNEKLSLLLAKRYRYSSEKSNRLQGSLFDEAELEVAIAALEEQLSSSSASTDKNKPSGSSPRSSSSPSERPKRKPLPSHLRRVTIDLDCSDEEKARMGDGWTLIGWETSEQLAVQEREYYVKQLRRAKYVKNTANADGAKATLKLAPAAAVILPKSRVDASVLAKLITGKFIDALSFYREQKVLAREGVEIGYSTLCSYPIQLHERLAPLKRLLYEYAASTKLWHLDETMLQVLHEPDRAATTKSYLWAIRAGPAGAPAVLFHYDPRRSFEALDAWLGPVAERFEGVIVSDEHKPYQRFAEQYPGIAARGGCWSHCRRKFVDAVKGRRHQSDAHQVVAMIATLYRLENKLRGLEGEAKVRARQKHLAPQLSKIHALASALQPLYLGKGLMRTAITYVLNNWSSLTACLHHGELPLDNNPIENAIRPFTVGRRNWLFAGSPNGAAASAFMYSLVESAKANGWEPRAYLNTLFEHYPLASCDEQRRALLPMFLKKP